MPHDIEQPRHVVLGFVRALRPGEPPRGQLAAQPREDLLPAGFGEVVASYYLAETGREKILARLRGELAAWGLARSQGAHEPEDHMAGLFDVMRHLISLGSEDAALQRQQGFFDRYIARSYPGFCGAISKSEKANFYRHVAQFAEAFFAVETEAL